jgi:hypothetical protein
MKLCDNPSCRSHCEVSYRQITTDGEMAWCFNSGLALTKDQLECFDPNAKVNTCRNCRGCYDGMVNAMRKLARRMAEQEA